MKFTFDLVVHQDGEQTIQTNILLTFNMVACGTVCSKHRLKFNLEYFGHFMKIIQYLWANINKEASNLIHKNKMLSFFSNDNCRHRQQPFVVVTYDKLSKNLVLSERAFRQNLDQYLRLQKNPGAKVRFLLSKFSNIEVIISKRLIASK